MDFANTRMAIRILLVDEQILIREGIAAIIRNEPGFEIAGQVETVEEAIERADRVKPDIILMDFPIADGTRVEGMRQILARQPDCKIVFLTQSEEGEHMLEAVRAGASGCLVKDMPSSKLITMLRSVYRGERALSRSLTLRLMKEVSCNGIPGQPNPLEPLTVRELEVLEKIAVGKSNQEIAAEFFLSENTIKYHVHSLLSKLRLSDRKEAARYARENGLFEKTTYHRVGKRPKR